MKFSLISEVEFIFRIYLIKVAILLYLIKVTAYKETHQKLLPMYILNVDFN